MIRQWLGPRHNPAPLMFALLLAWGAGQILWGERLQRHGGFGWDGYYYRSVVEHLGQPNPEITLYTACRALPCFAVHSTLKALGMPLDNAHILHAFLLCNLLMFAVSLAALLACCREMQIGVRGQWLAFLAVFCNYVHLKQHWISCVVTDVWAFAACMLALLFYLRRQSIGVLLASLVGWFCWPLMTYFGAVLVLLPRRAATVVPPPRRAGAPYRLHVVVALGASLLVAARMVQLVYVRHFEGSVPSQIIHALHPLSIACSCAYLFFVLKDLLDSRGLYDWRNYLSRGTPWRLAAVGALFGCTVLAKLWLARWFTKPGEVLTPLLLLKMIFITSIAKPFLFLVAHVIWYGPIILAMALCWKRACREAHRYGVGMVMMMAFGAFMSLNPESRQSMTFFPAFVLVTVKVLETRTWDRRRALAFVGLALLLSKAWLPLNRVPWPPDLHDAIFEHPMQLFFMSFGGYMTTPSWLIQGAAVLFAGIVVAWVVRGATPAHQARATEPSLSQAA